MDCGIRIQTENVIMVINPFPVCAIAVHACYQSACTHMPSVYLIDLIVPVWLSLQDLKLEKKLFMDWLCTLHHSMHADAKGCLSYLSRGFNPGRKGERVF